ncbi:MAG TPA: nucleotidyl transferase AbiEii/AbiGii toxin family protein [Polyangiaceae bacterium]
MIPRAYIDEWRSTAPWSQDAWVEQDLIISRALVELFGVPDIGKRLAFRGGTAIYKLHVHPAARYSEDIDLVQPNAEPIGETFDLVRSILDPWLGTPKRELKDGRSNLVYRFQSEGAPPIKLRLKLEINTREHFTELGLMTIPLHVENRWFSGTTNVTTFAPEELFGTKLRALYQRKKGRDLFDLWMALDQGIVNATVLLHCFNRYMTEGGHSVTRALFEENLHHKSNDAAFRGDIAPLVRPGVAWDFDHALRVVSERIIALLPGEPWKGPGG